MQKQKEFSAVYEIVKTERNKFVAQIQNSSQHVSEMKEKFKILQSECDILRMENSAKDKNLHKISLEAQKERIVRDQLLAECDNNIIIILLFYYFYYFLFLGFNVSTPTPGV